MIVPTIIMLVLFGIFFFFGIWSENARRNSGEYEDNEEFDYGHNVDNYHSDGEEDLL